jgi:hypothetical protein
MSWERGNEAWEVKQWSGRRIPKEEEEGVFITPSPELAVGGSLRPGRVTRLLTEPSRVTRPLVSVDPVGMQGKETKAEG